MTSATTRPRKWIDAEIAALDPTIEWEQIYRLGNTYRPTDFMLDLIYVHVFPHFMVPAHGSEPVWRNGDDAKVVNRASARADETSLHNMIWWYHGPKHPQTKKSVATVNRIHAHYESLYPGSFQHHSDYVHVWCFSAATMHRLRLKMGLSGLSEKEKVAAHRFWKEMADLFVVPDDPSDHHPKDDFPADFDGIIAWLDEFESRDWPPNPTGAITSRAVMDQFLFRYIPRPLRPLMRAAITSFYAESVLKTYGLTAPPRPLKYAIRRLCGAAMALADRFAPDPTESYIERRESMTAAERTTLTRRRHAQDDEFARKFRAESGTASGHQSVAGCPHLAATAHQNAPK